MSTVGFYSTSLIFLPQEYGYTYQTVVTGGTKHLPQTVKGGGSGFCLNYANEDIQSSESGCHFSHYKAASYNWYLLVMHAAKLTLVASTGVPLVCWGNGLTVFFKKVFGNIYIDKMRAICLLEANYNWLNKVAFAKQMMDKAFQGDIIPAEQFAKRGSQATKGVLKSGLFCDIAQALHKTAAIESVDLANCYDAVAHPIV
jgi:hypothetical protein